MKGKFWYLNGKRFVGKDKKYPNEELVLAQIREDARKEAELYWKNRAAERSSKELSGSGKLLDLDKMAKEVLSFLDVFRQWYPPIVLSYLF